MPFFLKKGRRGRADDVVALVTIAKTSRLSEH